MKSIQRREKRPRESWDHRARMIPTKQTKKSGSCCRTIPTTKPYLQQKHQLTSAIASTSTASEYISISIRLFPLVCNIRPIIAALCNENKTKRTLLACMFWLAVPFSNLIDQIPLISLSSKLYFMTSLIFQLYVIIFNR